LVAFINFGRVSPPIKASKVWLNDVVAYAGIAAVDLYTGAPEPTEDDPQEVDLWGGFLLGEPQHFLPSA
jgi:uncharacterized protein (DUF39 family)